MSTLAIFSEAFLTVLSPSIFFLLVLCVAVGIIFGAIPGLSASMAVALFLPVTFSMEPTTGICVLIALYVGGVSGGLISAILLNIPGTSGSVATTFDGYPMAQRGEAGRAIGIAIISSFLGSLFSFTILIFLAPQLAAFALKFSPVEYFAVIIFAMTMVVTLAGDSMIKGLMSACLGLLLATIGIAPVDGTLRFTMGFRELNAGFSILPALIGLFAVTELFSLAEAALSEKASTIIKLTPVKGFGFSVREYWGQRWNWLRSSCIGLCIGILPGIGDTASNMIAYSVAKNRAKHPERFGTGVMDGIVAPEAANNASIGGALTPLLSLGIPGDGVTAMILGGFMIHGLTPGPLLFVTNKPLVYCIFATCIVAIFLVVFLEYFGMRVFVKLLRIPKYLLLPVIMLACVVGAFAANNRIFDAQAILFFGLIGYGMRKMGMPTAPFVLMFVLGGLMETSFRRGLLLTQGSYTEFIQRPISATFLAVAALVLTYGIYRHVLRTRNAISCDESQDPYVSPPN